MPAFYQQPMANDMPLTPPDSGSGYGYSSMHYASGQFARRAMNQQRQDGNYEYQQAYIPPSAAAHYQHSTSNYQPTNNLPPIQNFYEPMGAPILPPLRIQDHVSFADDYQRRLQQEQDTAAAREQQRKATKDEKATGGVSAKLDYDMDRMTDFVTEATQSIFQRSISSQPSFRKWVHQVLSATRLPSATILLSLHFLNDRVAHHGDTIAPGENQIYRLLAVALILGSKFLDDNTFINRSWSDVTAIKVAELNKLELFWLGLIDYRLHVKPDEPNGLKAWFNSWSDYNAKCNTKQQLQQQQQNARLSPLDTNVYRQSGNRERFSPYPTPYTASSHRSFDTPHSSNSSQYAMTPYLPADPWSQAGQQAVDEFYNRRKRYPTLSEMDDVNRRLSEERARQAAYAYQQGAHQPSYYQSNYGSGWDQQAWNDAHRYDCNCSACTYNHYRPYPMASSYSAQTVMG